MTRIEPTPEDARILERRFRRLLAETNQSPTGSPLSVLSRACGDYIEQPKGAREKIRGGTPLAVSESPEGDGDQLQPERTS